MTGSLYTIGHSNHPIDRFTALLAQHGIGAIADVRSMPYSRFNPQFNQKTLRTALADAGIRYVFGFVSALTAVSASSLARSLPAPRGHRGLRAAG